MILEYRHNYRKLKYRGIEFTALTGMKYIAINKNGNVYAYDMKPHPIPLYEGEEPSMWAILTPTSNFNGCYLGTVRFEDGEDWKNTLEEIEWTN